MNGDRQRHSTTTTTVCTFEARPTSAIAQNRTSCQRVPSKGFFLKKKKNGVEQFENNQKKKEKERERELYESVVWDSSQDLHKV